MIRAKSLHDGEDKTYLGYTGIIHSLLTKGTLLFGAGDHGEIHVWNILTSKLIETLKGHERSVISMCFVNCDLYSSGDDSYIIGWVLF